MYLHHRDSKIFFHPAKFDNFKDEKISDFKTVLVSQNKNLFSGSFFYVLGVKKYFEIFIKNILTKKLHKMKLKNI